MILHSEWLLSLSANITEEKSNGKAIRMEGISISEKMRLFNEVTEKVQICIYKWMVNNEADNSCIKIYLSKGHNN